MGKLKTIKGLFTNGIPFVKFGSGEKKMMVFLGGPGNQLPTGLEFKMYSQGFIPFKEEYTIYLVTRKSDLPENYTTRDMANDYADMINQDFKAKVDVIVGISYGGMILQHFAADYPKKAEHMIIAMAAHKGSEEGMKADEQFAKYLSEGKTAKAYAALTEVFATKGLKKVFYKIILFIGGLFMGKPEGDTFSSDILTEVKAEKNHHANDRLKEIPIPILILCGDKDYYFPLEYYQEMAELIPDAILEVYPDKGHDIITMKRFTEDIKRFISNK
jgi:pimeloyl-ACP methyl ester carboxylesterase